MNHDDFFKLALKTEIREIELNRQNEESLVDKYFSKYKRNEFRDKSLNLLSDIRVEAKKLKKLEGSK